MSQILTPIDGGQETVVTTINNSRVGVLSPKAIELRNLSPQPTQWQPEGRPIYKRLPIVSEAYQIDFYEEKGKGWVYIPRGEGIFGPRSAQVVASDDKQFIVIKGGTVIWEYGEISVDPVVIDCKLVGFQNTRYLIGYQLYYDDAPFEAQYSVTDYSLQGYELEISSSVDTAVGWRFPAVNAFLSDDSYWKNRDDYFPSYAQPAETFISWKSPKYSAYSKITLRCPPNTNYSCLASLSVKIEGEWVITQEANIDSDSEGQFFTFELNEPTFQDEWKVSWDIQDIAISQITISGIITLLKRPATASTRSSLVAYPENAVPKTVTNSEGQDIPLTLCALAYVDVDELYQVQRIDDVRDIVYREFRPVAEWLTRSQDEDLINLYEQVLTYPVSWMSPPQALKQEYVALREKFVELSDSVVLGN